MAQRIAPGGWKRLALYLDSDRLRPEETLFPLFFKLALEMETPFAAALKAVEPKWRDAAKQILGAVQSGELKNTFVSSLHEAAGIAD